MSSNVTWSQRGRFIQYDIVTEGCCDVSRSILVYIHALRWIENIEIVNLYLLLRPPLWSSGQSSWLQIQGSRVPVPALPDLLRSSGSGTGRGRIIEELREWKSSGSGLENRD
jgi:hypothetical protein